MVETINLWYRDCHFGGSHRYSLPNLVTSTSKNLILFHFIYYFSPLLQHEECCVIVRSIREQDSTKFYNYTPDSSLGTHLIKLIDPSNRNIFEQNFLILENIFRKIPSVLDQAITQGVVKSLSAFVNPNESVSNLFYGNNKLFRKMYCAFAKSIFQCQ